MARSPKLQQATLGLKRMMSCGRCFGHRLFLGKASHDDLEQGLAGISVLVSQPAPNLKQLLPPTAEQLLENFATQATTPL